MEIENKLGEYNAQHNNKRFVFFAQKSAKAKTENVGAEGVGGEGASSCG